VVAAFGAMFVGHGDLTASPPASYRRAQHRCTNASPYAYVAPQLRDSQSAFRHLLENGGGAACRDRLFMNWLKAEIAAPRATS